MSRSALVLSRDELEKIKNYRYQTNGLTTIEIYIFNPFWNFIANNLYPDWLAPNVITLAGLIVPIIQLVTIAYFSPNFTGVLPNWVLLINALSNFWYMTLDATDGKQARRTDNCSPLGQILDHNLDQFTQTCFMVGVLAMLQTGPNIWTILAFTPGVMSMHYSVEYRTHFTNFHQLVVGFLGSTEQLCIVISITLVGYFSEKSSDFYLTEIPIPGLDQKLMIRDLVLIFSLLGGLHYNIENMIMGYLAAKQKVYALACLFPYAQFFVMMYCSSWSRFFEAYTLWFIVMNGVFLLYANGIFNLNTTAGMQFDWFFFEPLILISLLAADNMQVLTDSQAAMLYVAYVSWLTVKYLLFMASIIEQINTFMGLRFLKVKPIKNKSN